MRIKNFTFLVLMGLFGLFSTNLFAQEDATIAPEDIYYWIGEGEHQVVFIVNWNEPDTALAWGYRFSQNEVTVKDVMDKIADADYRFSYEGGSSYVNNLFFNDGVLDLSLTEPGWVMYLVNGETYWDTYEVKTLVDGDYVKWGDTFCGTLIDPTNYIYVWEKEVAPVYALAEEAMIDFSEILYWIGEGENEVVFAVNWAEPNICYAWGFRFSGTDIILKDVMDAIANADGRFDYVGDESMVYDIKFDDGTNQLMLAGMYWMYNINGGMAWYGYTEQAVYDGDFVKFGDESCGTYIAPWTQVWETPVTPVSVYNTSVVENSVDMTLYPNPATSYTMLEGQMVGSTVTVSDLQGRVLRSFVVTNDEPVRIETEGFQAGLYFVTVSDGANRQTVKLSVK